MKKLDMFFVIDEYFIICRWLQQLLWSSWRFKCKWLEEVGIKWGTRFVKTCVSINYFVRFFASNFDFPCNLLQNDTYKDVFLWVLRNILRNLCSSWATASAPILCSLCYILFSWFLFSWTFSWLPAPPILTKHCSKRFFWLEKNGVARKRGKLLRKEDNFQNSMMLIFHLNRWYPHL